MHRSPACLGTGVPIRCLISRTFRVSYVRTSRLSNSWRYTCEIIDLRPPPFRSWIGSPGSGLASAGHEAFVARPPRSVPRVWCRGTTGGPPTRGHQETRTASATRGLLGFTGSCQRLPNDGQRHATQRERGERKHLRSPQSAHGSACTGTATASKLTTTPIHRACGLGAARPTPYTDIDESEVSACQKPSLEFLGELVAAKRGELGIRATAEKIGISPATLSRVENGHLPDVVNFGKLCKWLNVDSNALLGFDSDAARHPPCGRPFQKTADHVV